MVEDYIRCVCCMCGSQGVVIATKTNEFLCERCMHNDAEAKSKKGGYNESNN